MSKKVLVWVVDFRGEIKAESHINPGPAPTLYAGEPLLEMTIEVDEKMDDNAAKLHAYEKVIKAFGAVVRSRLNPGQREAALQIAPKLVIS